MRGRRAAGKGNPLGPELGDKLGFQQQVQGTGSSPYGCLVLASLLCRDGKPTDVGNAATLAGCHRDPRLILGPPQSRVLRGAHFCNALAAGMPPRGFNASLGGPKAAPRAVFQTHRSLLGSRR